MFIPCENCIRFFIIIFLANFQIAFINLRWWINIRFLPLSFPSHSVLSCFRLPCLLVAANNMTAAVHWLWKPTYRSQPVHHSDPISVYIPMPKSFAPPIRRLFPRNRGAEISDAVIKDPPHCKTWKMRGLLRYC